MKKRDVLGILVLILAGIMYNFYIKNGEVVFFDGCSMSSKKLTQKKHQNVFVEKIIHYPEAKDIKQITIDNPAGDIVIVKSKEGSVSIEPIIKVFHKNRERAKKIVKQIKIIPRKTEKKIAINIETDKEFPYRRVRLGFKCQVPQDIELDIRNRYGNIDIENVGKKISIDQYKGDLFIKNIDSNLKVKSHHGLVRIYNIGDVVELSSNFSRVKIRNVPLLKLKCSQAKVWIDQVEDTIDTTYAGYSSIVISDAGKLKINARHTRLKLKNIKDYIEIKNSHAYINMENILGDINIKSRECNIVLNKISIDNLFINNSYNDIDINDISCKNIDITLDHGDLNLTLKKIQEGIIAKTRHAEVVFNYPTDLNLFFDINSNNGKIINRTSTNFTITQKDQKYILKTNEGLPKIDISSDYGDITLRNYYPNK
jgi:hypothetical protein